MFIGKKPRTVNEAVAGLIKAQNDLERVSTERTTKAQDARNEAAVLIAGAEMDEAEASRAQKVLDKLKSITEGDEE